MASRHKICDVSAPGLASLTMRSVFMCEFRQWLHAYSSQPGDVGPTSFTTAFHRSLCQFVTSARRIACHEFLSCVSILLLTRDIDIVILSVRLSVRLSVCP